MDGILHQTFKARIGPAKQAPLASFHGHWQQIDIEARHVLPEALYSCFNSRCKAEYIHPTPSHATLKLTVPVFHVLLP